MCLEAVVSHGEPAMIEGEGPRLAGWILDTKDPRTCSRWRARRRKSRTRVAVHLRAGKLRVRKPDRRSSNPPVMAFTSTQRVSSPPPPRVCVVDRIPCSSALSPSFSSMPESRRGSVGLRAVFVSLLSHSLHGSLRNRDCCVAAGARGAAQPTCASRPSRLTSRG
jgi:hypothetical protein